MHRATGQRERRRDRGFDLATGKEKWKWTGDGVAYASPAVLTLGESRAVVAETSSSIVAVGVADGKPLWKTAYKTRYNASSPMTEGDKVVYSGSGKGTTAVKLEKKDGELKATELWSNPDGSVIYNTPVIKDGLLYGLSERNRLFCLSMKDGKKAWETAFGGGGRGRTGYGSIVDVGAFLMALTPAGELVVFEPGDKEFKQAAKYAVGKGTYAYPVVSGNRISIKDADSVTMWVVE
jgi:outer membrane protein assembly factor BamB